MTRLGLKQERPRQLKTLLSRHLIELWPQRQFDKPPRFGSLLTLVQEKSTDLISLSGSTESGITVMRNRGFHNSIYSQMDREIVIVGSVEYRRSSSIENKLLPISMFIICKRFIQSSPGPRSPRFKNYDKTQCGISLVSQKYPLMRLLVP